MTMIKCRSRESSVCYHGQPEERVYENTQAEDGTFDGETVICDACYIAIGQPLRGERIFITGKRTVADPADGLGR